MDAAMVHRRGPAGAPDGQQGRPQRPSLDSCGFNAHTSPFRPEVSCFGEPIYCSGLQVRMLPALRCRRGSGGPAELHALDVRGLQPFGAGFHFKADFCAFL